MNNWLRARIECRRWRWREMAVREGQCTKGLVKDEYRICSCCCCCSLLVRVECINVRMYVCAFIHVVVIIKIIFYNETVRGGGGWGGAIPECRSCVVVAIVVVVFVATADRRPVNSARTKKYLNNNNNNNFLRATGSSRTHAPTRGGGHARGRTRRDETITAIPHGTACRMIFHLSPTTVIEEWKKILWF